MDRGFQGDRGFNPPSSATTPILRYCAIQPPNGDNAVRGHTSDRCAQLGQELPKMGETVTSFQDALIAASMAEKAAPYVHPRLAAERHEVTGADRKSPLTAPPQVILYLPDNGRDPDFASPVPFDAVAEDTAVMNGKANGHDPAADSGVPEGTEEPNTD